MTYTNLTGRRSMRKVAVAVALLVAAGLLVLAAAAFADHGHGRGGHHGNGGRTFSAKLVGFEETPSESTPGRGTFRARIVNGDTIHYKLHYQGFEAGEGNTLFSHIHFGQVGVAGGVVAFLCGGGNKPPCTPTEGTFEGDIVASDIVGPAGQGIAPGEFDEVITAMRKGYTYANVHTTLNPAGLIRGQIHKGHGHGEGGGHR
jgi:CHRD domain